MYLNWALGLHALGCQVIWLEGVNIHRDPTHKVQAYVATLKIHLERYNFAESIALYSVTSEPLSPAVMKECLDLDAACEADLLLNLAYGIPPKIVGRFRRSALVDIDPGLTQIWISRGQMRLAKHDLYFTIGETVGKPGASFPDCGLRWHYTPPPVFLPAWAPTQANSRAPYTTITSWWDGWVKLGGQNYSNRKRDAFLQFLDPPNRTSYPLELAICRAADKNDREMLQKSGWRVSDAFEVTSTPWDYQGYIKDSRGEFSCVKPAYVRLQTTWISDRTLCYLASGKPAVIQHTGLSQFLPDSAGMFRFHNVEEAARCIERIENDYERQCRLARALAEDYFDAKKVAKSVVERALA